MNLNKIAKILLIFGSLCWATAITLQAQDERCFRIVDTTHLQARLIILSRNWSECPSFYYIATDDTPDEQFILSFLTLTPPPKGQLMLASNMDARFFALLKIFSEDSLSNRFSNKEISHAFMHFKHPDSTSMMRMPPINSPLRQIGDLVYMCSYMGVCTTSLLGISDIKFVEKRPPLKIRHDKKYRNIMPYKYSLGEIEFDSWGIVVEFTSGCQCRECQSFCNDTQECNFLEIWPDQVLRLFIPMSKIEQQ